MSEHTWDLFIAHASADKAVAEELYDLLTSRCRVFLDSKCIELGDDWDTTIAQAQRESLVTVVLVSERTEAAYYQREEIAAAIDMARENKEKHRVVPVYLDGWSEEAKTHIPYGLRPKHGIALPKTGDLPALADRLWGLVTRLVGESPLPTASHGPNTGHFAGTDPVQTSSSSGLVRLLGVKRRLKEAVLAEDPGSGVPLLDPHLLRRLIDDLEEACLGTGSTNPGRLAALRAFLRDRWREMDRAVRSLGNQEEVHGGNVDVYDSIQGALSRGVDSLEVLVQQLALGGRPQPALSGHQQEAMAKMWELWIGLDTAERAIEKHGVQSREMQQLAFEVGERARAFLANEGVHLPLASRDLLVEALRAWDRENFASGHEAINLTSLARAVRLAYGKAEDDDSDSC